MILRKFYRRGKTMEIPGWQLLCSNISTVPHELLTSQAVGWFIKSKMCKS